MKTIISFSFSRVEIENIDLTRFLALCGHWPQLWPRELRAKYNSLRFFAEGYDDESLTLHQIPEVRRFYNELHEQWPWWCFFFSDTPENLLTPYLCLLSSTQAESSRSSVECNHNELRSILRTDLSRMCYLAEIAEMSDETMRARGCVVMRNFVPAFESPGDGFFGKENTKKDRNEQT